MEEVGIQKEMYYSGKTKNAFGRLWLPLKTSIQKGLQSSECRCIPPVMLMSLRFGGWRSGWRCGMEGGRLLWFLWFMSR